MEAIEEGDLTKDTLFNLQDFFWYHYPHEISWPEFREANPELYDQVRAAGQLLITLGIEEEHIFKIITKGGNNE